MENKGKNRVSFFELISKHKFSFVLNFILVFVITFSILYLFDLVPPEFNILVGRYPEKVSTNLTSGEIPLSIKIPVIGVDTQVYNPESTSTDILNNYLLKGAVRYPGSGLLGGIGNILIFGHNTGYKIVQNQAFKTFNGLKNLKAGEMISVFSDTNEYIYKVSSVKLVSADKALVEFDVKSRLLTLSTCDVFGEKQDRYVAEAEFVSKNPITK